MFVEARGKKPKVGSNVFIAPTATLIGDVEVGDGTSIWFQTTLRADVEPIIIGKDCNVQDGTVIHGTYGKCGVTLEDRVSIGHSVILHGCHIKEETLIGMGSLVMDQAVIGKRCLIGAGSLVTERTEIPDGWLAWGRPAKPVRELNEKELAIVTKTPDNYLLYKTWYNEGESE